MKKTKTILEGVIRRGMILVLLIIITESVFAQTDRKYIRKGNRQYSKNDFEQSETLYRKAEEKGKHSPEATFNIGDALYKQKKYEEAGKQFADNTKQTTDAEAESAAWYNLGNSLLQAEKIEESIEAYKNALKLNPNNFQAKYNLGYAQDLLQEQQQQQQQQNQDQENKEDQDKEQDQSQENNEQQNQQNKQQEQQQHASESELSKEDAERLLDALANDEREIQEKVKREKASKTRTRVLKNW